MKSLRPVLGRMLHAPWRRAVARGDCLVLRQEWLTHAQQLRPPDTLQIRTDHYQIHGMASPPLLAVLVGVHPDPGAFLALLPNVELVGNPPMAVWRGRVVLESVLGSQGYLLQHGDPRSLLLRRWLPLQQRWPTALLLANCLNQNYFHWVAEALPLLDALEQVQSLGMPASQPLVVVNAPVPTFVWQWLEIFGIEPARVRPWTHRRVRVERLLLPSQRFGRLCDEHPHWGRHLYPRWALEFVRRRALLSLSGQPLLVKEKSTRVFLSRPRSGSRGLANHDQVLACLQRHGYEEVLAEQLTVREQIALFASLTHLVAIHGAGMVNLIFSSQARVIELFPANRHFGFTYQFMQISGHFCDCHHLLACPADAQQNMQVPLDLLEQLLHNN